MRISMSHLEWQKRWIWICSTVIQIDKSKSYNDLVRKTTALGNYVRREKRSNVWGDRAKVFELYP